MRKIYLKMATLLLTVGVASVSNAQIFFTEDFEGAMDGGTDLPTGWTETGLSIDGIWNTADAPTATSGWLTYPAALNGTQFAFTNDDACDCDKSADRMILPAQDFSGMVGVSLTFDLFHEDAAGDILTCEVSTDGGTIWTVVSTYTGTGGVWVDDETVDLSAYAGMSNVTISFLYNDVATWGYGSGIDDVKLNQLTSSDDLSVISSAGEYTIIPMSQATAMNLDATALNNGLATVTDAILTANVYIGASLDQTSASPAGTITSTGTLLMSAGTYTPLVAGDYTFEYIISSVSILDGIPSNDTLYYQFTVSNDYYARDNGIPTINLGVGTGNYASIGALFEVNNTTTLDSVFSFYGTAFLNDTLQIEIYDVAAGLPSTLIGMSDYYVINATDTANGFINLTLAVTDLSMSPLILSAGTYFVAAKEALTGENYGLSMTNDIFTPNTIFASISGGAWTTIEALGFPNSPIIRPRFNLCTSVVTTTVNPVDVLCNGDTDGTAEAIPAGGTPTYTYSWDALAGSQTTATATGLGAGTYYVTITDVNGCIAVDSAVINEPTAIAGAIVDNGDGTATASATGGTPGYTYLWDAAAGNQTTETATGLSNGSTYSVTITDANGCTTIEMITIGGSGLENVSSNVDVKIYPNPANAQVSVQLNSNVVLDEVVIYVTDLAGNIVMTNTIYNIENGTINLDTEALSSGIYTVNILVGNDIVTKRLSIVK